MNWKFLDGKNFIKNTMRILYMLNST